jgi:hypothetical protein
MINQKFEQIQNEKRRRNSIYNILDYLDSNHSYFDFLTEDAFRICSNTVFLSYFLKKEIITKEIFLLSFFNSKTEFGDWIKEFDLNLKVLLNLITKENSIYDQYLTIKELILGVDIEDDLYQEEKEFSSELLVFLKKAAKKARHSFKTPIISPEILFLTLMEDKNEETYEIRNNMFLNKTSWYLFRYELIKNIYEQESIIQNEVPINQNYFAYLLRLNTNAYYFPRLMDFDLLDEGVSYFRNTLVSIILREDIFEDMTKRTESSIKACNFIRKYSS